MNDENLRALYRGVKILHDPVRNKGTAFTEAERDHLKLRGLLPPRVHTVAEQELRVLGNFRERPTDLERYQRTLMQNELENALELPETVLEDVDWVSTARYRLA